MGYFLALPFLQMHRTSVPETVLLILKETIHDQSSSGELKSRHLNRNYGQIRKKQGKNTGLEIHQVLHNVTLLMRETKDVCRNVLGKLRTEFRDPTYHSFEKQIPLPNDKTK